MKIKLFNPHSREMKVEQSSVVYAEDDRLPRTRHLPCQQHGNSSPVPSSAQQVQFGVIAAQHS